MEFDAFIAQGWDDHVNDASGVAARLQAQGPAQVTQASQIVPLAHLAHHVLGEHLGQWQEGIDFLQRLGSLPSCPPDDAAAQALRRFGTSLTLAAGIADGRAALGPSDRVRVSAMAAASLAERDTARALALFHDALALAEAAALPDTDPCTRAMAVCGNNLASTLEAKTGRSASERELMILAAQTARRYWALAGGKLEVERAEYRLAMSWLQAGDFGRARQHAQHCLEIVQANALPPLEIFFGWEAAASVERAAGDSAAHARALAQAEAAFEALEPADRSWCQASLDKLRA